MNENMNQNANVEVSNESVKEEVKKEKKKNSKNVIIVLLLVLILCLVGFVVVNKNVLNNDNGSTNTNTTTENKTEPSKKEEVNVEEKKEEEKVTYELSDKDKALVYAGVETVERTSSNESADIKIPKININSENINAINKKINEENAYSNYSKGLVLSINYEYSVNGNIISIVVITKLMDDDLIYKKAYNVDLNTQKLLNSEELLKEKNLTKDVTKNKITEKINEFYNNAGNGMPSDIVESQKARALNDIDSAQYYLNEEKRVVAIYNIYPTAGGGEKRSTTTFID